ncbi:MAG: hypothetical protein EPN68_07980 [Rhodanobacter sp.]|jgi:hypothetical protein|nr:MAG: hypothetical protein EPN68_07980 [Rhodanobacter sp.]
MRYLALMLLAPVLLIFAWLYWCYPKNLRRTWPRRLFDIIVLLLAAVLGVHMATLGFEAVPAAELNEFGRVSGGIWKQVLPALYGYGAFSVVLALGLLGRFALFRR